MNSTLRKDADAIIASSLNAVLPDEAVRRALKAFAPKLSLIHISEPTRH